MVADIFKDFEPPYNKFPSYVPVTLLIQKSYNNGEKST